MANNEVSEEQALDTIASQIPARVGSDFSWIQLPELPKPYMIQNVLKCKFPLYVNLVLAQYFCLSSVFDVVRFELYPAEICLWDEVAESSPITFLMSSPLFVNAVLFMIDALSDNRSGRPCGLRAQQHLVETLRVLQDTVASRSDLNISDHTIMTVNILALTAERLDDQESMTNHVEGLKQMVRLRGGFQKWKPYIYDLQSKVCRCVNLSPSRVVQDLILMLIRADLGLAIRFGHRPSFFSDELSWTVYLDSSEHDLDTDSTSRNKISVFVQSLDWRLGNVFKDLREFSHLCNLAHQTGYKLRRHTFGEIIVSVLYRLLHLSFPDSLVDELMRLGMIIFSSVILLQRQKSHRAILDAFANSLNKIQHQLIDIPNSILFWLLTIWKSYVSEQIPKSQLEDWFEELVKRLTICDWEQARTLLKSIMWIDVLHDSKGEECMRNLGTKSS